MYEQSMNSIFLNKKGWPKCYAKSPAVQGAFWLIPGPNSQPVKYRGLESPQSMRVLDVLYALSCQVQKRNSSEMCVDGTVPLLLVT